MMRCSCALALLFALNFASSSEGFRLRRMGGHNVGEDSHQDIQTSSEIEGTDGLFSSAFSSDDVDVEDNVSDEKHNAENPFERIMQDDSAYGAESDNEEHEVTDEEEANSDADGMEEAIDDEAGETGSLVEAESDIRKSMVGAEQGCARLGWSCMNSRCCSGARCWASPGFDNPICIRGR